MHTYIAITGAGGIGKTTTLSWLNGYFKDYMPVVILPDFIDPLDLERPIEDIIHFLFLQKLKRNFIIQEYINNKTVVFCDRTCLDPLALAMTLLSERKWKAIEDLHNREKYIYGHHILLKAPHSVIRERRIKRGSDPRSSFLVSFNISQSQYEKRYEECWRFIHKARNIKFYEVDFSSENPEVNLERLMNVINPLINIWKL